MATGATETGGSSTATEIGNLEMSTKSNIIPEILPTSEVLPTSEMGSSSNANGNGDLALKITKMFASSEEQFSIQYLISVPDHLRKLDEQAFTPLLISIGPIHHSNAKLQTMKKLKVQFCECFIKRANIDLQNLVEIIREKEKYIRSYYAETIVSSISTDDFVTMILVDGMFILQYFLISFSHLEEEISKIGIPEWMQPILQSDLVLLENQLPFFVLEMMFQQANFPAESRLEHLSLRKLAITCFRAYNFQMVSEMAFSGNIKHFTDLVRYFYLAKSGPFPSGVLGGAKLSYSATQLHEAGIKFMEAPEDEDVGKNFVYIRFNSYKGVLQIPCITLDDKELRLIRNIIALEQSHYVGQAYVTDLFVILDCLINSSKDVDLLCHKGILINRFGDSDAAASAINRLNTNILWVYMNPRYSKMCEDLNAFYKKRWHRWKTTLWHQYFSTPWRAASTSAAIILLLLTAIQTICSLKSTTW